MFIYHHRSAVHSFDIFVSQLELDGNLFLLAYKTVNLFASQRPPCLLTTDCTSVVIGKHFTCYATWMAHSSKQQVLLPLIGKGAKQRCKKMAKQTLEDMDLPISHVQNRQVITDRYLEKQTQTESVRLGRQLSRQKHLLNKHEGLSSNLQHLHIKLSMAEYTCNADLQVQ